ncbi:MAG TPA: thiamine phosphate synthase [Candidatus Hydrogenedentes bacterium]|nr:thiamine phosphate synthase [Candidatus Hydrogenedentota bacterium]HOV74369.1 thiamine phosphate synthase [Candidatus Hydrogenedentota bacterium]
MTHAGRMALFRAGDLYVVITESFCGGRSAIEVLDAVLDAGVRLIQFREKDLDDAELFRRAELFRARIPEGRALLIVDDRVDVALAVGADGVHLGQSDLPVAAARRIAPELIIGASSHNPGEALAAQDAGASYVNIGPIFATQTKTVPTGAIGPDSISAIAPRLHIPFTCMGGIKAHNIGEVTVRGARHVAVVTAVTEAPDVRAAAIELRKAIRGTARP